MAWQRLDGNKSFIFLGTFAGILALIPIMMVKDALGQLVLFLFSTACFVCVAILTVKYYQVASRHNITYAFDKIDECYVVPAEHIDIVWAAFVAKKFLYRGIDVIPRSTMLEWFRTNPHGFWIVRCKGNNSGNLDILPLKPEKLRSFLAGEISERDISGNDLYSPAESSSIRDLYVESFTAFTVKKVNFLWHSMQGFPNATRAFFMNAEKIMASICDTSQIDNIYSIIANKGGQKVAERLGFKLYIQGSERPLDHHNVYCIKYKELVRNILKMKTDEEWYKLIESSSPTL